MLDAKKAILIGVSIALAIAFLVLLSVFLSWAKLQSMPEQTAQVKIVDKGEYSKSLGGLPPRTSTTRYITVEFSDGSRKSFRISSPKVLDAIQKGETGLLTYKERKDRKLFIRFEKN